MIFDELLLHNFGGYRGRHTMTLTPPHPGAPIVLFGGLNGAGKTTLVDGLHLALYGKRARCTSRGTLAYEEFLRRCINNQTPEREGAAVGLTFTAPDELGSHSYYHIERTWWRSGKGIRESLSVTLDGETDRLLSDRWDDHIEELLPLEIADLFFFDGERIEALADPTQASRVISTAVNSLLGLDLLQQLTTDLSVLERRKQGETQTDYERERIEALQATYDAREQARQDALQERSASQALLDRASHRYNAAYEAYREAGGDLADAREETEARRRDTRSRLDGARDELRETAAGALPLAMITPLLADVDAQAYREDETHRSRVLQRALGERDRDILALIRSESVPPDVLARVEAFLSDDRRRVDRLASSPEPYLNLSVELRGHLKNLQQQLIPTAQATAIEQLQHVADLQQELDDSERRLASIPAPEMLSAESTELLEAEGAYAEAQERLDAADTRLAHATKQAQDAEANLRSTLQGQARARTREAEANRILTHSERARDTVHALQDRLLVRHISSIEAAILDSFQWLSRKDSLITDVRLDPKEFTLLASDINGSQLTLERLSAGERQLLAVAILWGIARVSGRRVPTVVDTPLGRLDSEHRDNLLTRYFPYASEQVILFSTDEEIDEERARQLSPYIGRAYHLEYDERLAATAVRTGYFEEGANVA